jgi:hypothetical protein
VGGEIDVRRVMCDGSVDGVSRGAPLALMYVLR